MYRNKKGHVKGVRSFCFGSLNMPKLCRVVDLKFPINLKWPFRPGHLSQRFFKSEIHFKGSACALLEITFCQSL